MATRRDVMRMGVAAVVAMSARAPRALAADEETAEDGDVVPFLEPQPFDPKRPMLSGTSSSRRIG